MICLRAQLLCAPTHSFAADSAIGRAELRTSSESWIASLLTQWTVHSEALLPALDLPKKSARPSDEGSADGRLRGALTGAAVSRIANRRWPIACVIDTSEAYRRTWESAGLPTREHHVRQIASTTHVQAGRQVSQGETRRQARES